MKVINITDNIIFCIILLILTSCGSETAEKNFGEVKDVSAELIGIDELLQANNIIKLEDYIVLQNGSEAVEDFYFVYSYPDLRFLYSFARRGRGPNEYIFPSVVKNTDGNVLAFKDHATDLIAFYRITDSSAELQMSMTFKSDDSRFFWEINCIGDSLMLVKHQDYKTGARELWNPYDHVMVDSIPNTFEKLPSLMGKNYFTIFDDYQISANCNRFAVAYTFIDRIELGRINNGSITLESEIGVKSPPKFYNYGRREVKEYNIDKNIVYYENVYSGEKYVYALYSDDRLDNTEKNHSSVLEIYSWSGEPVCQLNLEYPIAYFAVDEEHNVIYGLNPNGFEDKVLIYRY